MAVRTPPSSDLEELEAPERTIVVPAADRPRFPRWIRFLIWTVAVVAVIAVGLQLSGGFPDVAHGRRRREVQPVQRLGHREPADEPALRQLPRSALRNGIQSAYDQLVLALRA